MSQHIASVHEKRKPIKYELCDHKNFLIKVFYLIFEHRRSKKPKLKKKKKKKRNSRRKKSKLDIFLNFLQKPTVKKQNSKTKLNGKTQASGGFFLAHQVVLKQKA